MKLNQKYGNYLLKILPIYSYNFNKNELYLNIPLNNIIQIFTFLKYHTHSQYKILTDICAVDYLKVNKRFQLIYNFLSIQFNSRIFIKINVSELDIVHSIHDIFNNSLWMEREIWDMFGIFFYKHPDLRRILTDYGFEGYPLRKDFPLSGFVETRYDSMKNRVVYDQINLSQDFRSFNFESPWKI